MFGAQKFSHCPVLTGHVNLVQQFSSIRASSLQTVRAEEILCLCLAPLRSVLFEIAQIFLWKSHNFGIEPRAVSEKTRNWNHVFVLRSKPLTKLPGVRTLLGMEYRQKHRFWHAKSKNDSFVCFAHFCVYKDVKTVRNIKFASISAQPRRGLDLTANWSHELILINECRD